MVSIVRRRRVQHLVGWTEDLLDIPGAGADQGPERRANLRHQERRAEPVTGGVANDQDQAATGRGKKIVVITAYTGRSLVIAIYAQSFVVDTRSRYHTLLNVSCDIELLIELRLLLHFLLIEEQPIGHPVEFTGKHANLITCLHLYLMLQVTAPDDVGTLGKDLDRFNGHRCHDDRPDNTHNNGKYGNNNGVVTAASPQFAYCFRYCFCRITELYGADPLVSKDHRGSQIVQVSQFVG